MAISLLRTLRYARIWLTGRDDLLQRELVLDPGGSAISLRPDPYGRWIVAANYLTYAAGYEGTADVAAALNATLSPPSRLSHVRPLRCVCR
jgi:hypothetical protein